MKMSRIETAVRVVLAFNEAFNHHDEARMMALMSHDCVFESSNPAPDGTVYTGKEAITQFWQAFFHDSPQAHIEIEEIFGFGYRCVALWRYDWLDEPGNKKHIRGVDIYQVKNGLISAQLSYLKGQEAGNGR